MGYGVIDVTGGKPAYVAHGVIAPGASAPLDQRLHVIYTQLLQVLRVFAPTAVAVEGVFQHKNARSALILGHARGVALLAAATERMTLFEYAPARVKRAVGAGGADGKDAVARMVTLQLGLATALERADAYDALAVAICHAHSLRVPTLASATSNRRAKSRVPDSWTDRLKPSVVRPSVGP